jgi:hypothetical protein
VLTKSLMVAFFACCTAFGPSQAQNSQAWLKGSESDDVIDFVDANSLEWNGNVLTGWTISYFKNAALLYDEKIVGHAITRVTWLCGVRKSYANLEASLYGRDGRAVGTLSPDKKWNTIFPSSIAEELNGVACKFAPIKAKAAGNEREPLSVSDARQLRSSLNIPRLDENIRQMQAFKYTIDGRPRLILYSRGDFLFAQQGDCGFTASGGQVVAVDGDWKTVSCQEYKDSMPRPAVSQEEIDVAYREYLIDYEVLARSVPETVQMAKRLYPWTPTSKTPSSPTRRPKARKR